MSDEPDHDAARKVAIGWVADSPSGWGNTVNLARAYLASQTECDQFRELDPSVAGAPVPAGGAETLRRLRRSLDTATRLASVMSNVCWSLGHEDREVGDSVARETLAGLADRWDAFRADIGDLLHDVPPDTESETTEPGCECPQGPAWNGNPESSYCTRCKRNAAPSESETTRERTTMDIYEEIKAERTKQDAKWGGPEHDDGHSLSEWISYIDRHLERVADGPEHEERYQLVRVAALAIAAIESLDREREGTPEPRETPTP